MQPIKKKPGLGRLFDNFGESAFPASGGLSALLPSIAEKPLFDLLHYL